MPYYGSMGTVRLAKVEELRQVRVSREDCLSLSEYYLSMAQVGSEAVDRSLWDAVSTASSRERVKAWLAALDVCAAQARLVADIAAELGFEDSEPLARRTEAIAANTRKALRLYLP